MSSPSRPNRNKPQPQRSPENRGLRHTVSLSGRTGCAGRSSGTRDDQHLLSKQLHGRVQVEPYEEGVYLYRRVVSGGWATDPTEFGVVSAPCEDSYKVRSWTNRISLIVRSTSDRNSSLPGKTAHRLKNRYIL